LQEIENELDRHVGIHKLILFINFTKRGKGLTAASQAIGIRPEHASRAFKRILVQLLAEKLIVKLR